MLNKILVLYLFTAILLTSFVAAYLMLNSRTKFVKILICLTCGVIIYTFGYMMELNAYSMNDALFWNQIQYISIPFLNGLWLMMGLFYSGRQTKFLDYRTFLIFIIPLITFFLRLTNSFHHLYYSGFEFIESGSHYFLKLGKAFWYYVQAGYILITAVLIIFLFLNIYKNSTGRERRPLMIMFIASIIPLLTLALILSDPLDIGIDYTVILLPFVIVLMTYAITRQDFLEVKALARADLFNTSESGMVLLNKYGIVVDFNKAARKFFLANDIKLETADITELLKSNDDLLSAFKSDETSTVISKNKKNFFELKTRIIRGKMSDAGYLKTITDITERVMIENHLKKISTIDELSQLTNRREFINRGNALISEAVICSLPVVSMMIDIDNFKEINDSFGHIVGDEVIKELSAVLRMSFRDQDIIARFGGEEFVVLMKGMEIRKAMERAEELRTSVKELKFMEYHQDRTITISLGVAMMMEGDDLDSLVHKADMAMYQSKKSGKDMVTLYKP